MIRMLEGPGFFRFFLALMVFSSHVTSFSLGAAAVYTFFILSGYWISAMWTERYCRASPPYLTYLVSRAWRLWPVFVLCSALTWAAVWFNGMPPAGSVDWPHEIFSNIFILGYKSLGYQPNSPAWSLDIEVQFYLIAPLLIIAMSRSLWTLAACAALSLIASASGLSSYIPAYLVFFAIGMAAQRADWKPTPKFAWGTFGLTWVLVGLCLLYEPLRGMILRGGHSGPLFVYNDAANGFVGIALGPWALYTVRNQGARADGLLGDLSYIVYLFHVTVLRMLSTASGTLPHRAFMAVSVLLVTLVGSLLIWRVMDHPLNGLRSNWVRSRLRARTAVLPLPAAFSTDATGVKVDG